MRLRALFDSIQAFRMMASAHFMKKEKAAIDAFDASIASCVHQLICAIDTHFLTQAKQGIEVCCTLLNKPGEKLKSETTKASI